MHCLVVDDHPVPSSGLRSLISSDFPDWKVSTATSIHEATECINAPNGKSINLVLLDLISHNENGTTLLSQLQQNLPTRSISTVIISSMIDEKTIALCRKLGAHGYVSKNDGKSEMTHAVQYASTDEEYSCLGNADASRTQTNNFPRLTSRQRDLIDLLLEGHSNKMIASILNLGYGTVKNYMFDLMRLLSVKSRLELVTKVRESGYQSSHDTGAESMRCVRCNVELVNS